MSAPQRSDSAPLHALRVVMYEGNGARALDVARRNELLTGLLEDGHQVTRPAPGGAVSPADDAPVLVIGEFLDGPPSAAERADGRATPPIAFEDITGLDAEQVRHRAATLRTDSGAAHDAGWKPWFPVIDYDRCTNCMQCLTFCLFDVYGVDPLQQIQVQNNSNCKTDCPACSRVCPEAAILFPKYTKSPINGAPVKEEDLQREAMKVDISALLGGDIYSQLKSRQTEARKRFSTERDESRALLERKRCLKKLKKDLDIPDEVLMTLPSAGEIEERAARARAKLEKRLARSRSAQDEGRRPPTTEDDWGI